MTAAELLDQAGALLLDFDGPVCSVFAGIPAPVVAEQLRTVLADAGHTSPEPVASSSDPFDVLEYAASLSDDDARYVEAAFTAHEVEAMTTAAPTEGAHELMQAWHGSGRPLAIVSNNSAAAISAYLDFYGLRPLVNVVSARESADVQLLKPRPHLLNQAVRRLGLPAERCVFVGDSLTDIEAAKAAGVLSIGYANKPGKRERFTSAGADAITEVLTDLAAVR
ncbi:HAD family hydrolase [Amycolatopsis thermoflava]|uniref:HAD superfamily hydrolase (TIGR01509 family)/HAD superfamily hydrolase (TIGR01549 family) n=1 Tax=Amycolatopsis thermoflava TaxID=84480 RepID=A0A3N2GXU7_9PSEU|nr:HAD-IA family hydrolase [Amycolatopsis thermoflava]ROS41397.1 HAD superfamily hydrolase (TIGR01509 family)/HAD superfamily hydrolase (TIGR01549 family) [Amycolatopsis thermoflava]